MRISLTALEESYLQKWVGKHFAKRRAKGESVTRMFPDVQSETGLGNRLTIFKFRNAIYKAGFKLSAPGRPSPSDPKGTVVNQANQYTAAALSLQPKVSSVSFNGVPVPMGGGIVSVLKEIAEALRENTKVQEAVKQEQERLREEAAEILKMLQGFVG